MTRTRNAVYFDEANPDKGDGGGTPPAVTAAPDTGAAKPWFDSFKDPEVKTWLTSYQGAYPDAEAVALKAFNIEKFVGADKAGRGVVLPKPEAKAEEWRAFFGKTGLVPEKTDGYKVPEAHAKDPVVAAFRDHAHKIGMPAPHFDAVLSFVDEASKAAATARLKEFQTRSESEMLELRTELGAGADEFIELSRRAARTFLPHSKPEEVMAMMNAMEGAVGTKKMMQLWGNIGRAMGEHNFIQGDSGSKGGPMTPEGARMRIAALKADSNWVKRYMDGGAAEKKEMEDLHKIANPEPVQQPS